MQSVPITTNVVILNPAYVEVYSIQHYVIKFISDLWQVCGFLLVPPVSPTNKTDSHDKTEILLKVALSNIIIIPRIVLLLSNSSYCTSLGIILIKSRNPAKICTYYCQIMNKPHCMRSICDMKFNKTPVSV